MSPRLSALAVAFVVAASNAGAAADPALTIYRADGDALFDSNGSPVADGYAIVHEQRAIKLTGGRQSVVVDGLPSTLDAEAVSIQFPGSTRVLGQRVMSAGDGGMLSAHRGETIKVTLRNSTVEGTLVGIDNGALILRGADGNVVYVRDYDTIGFAQGTGLPGSTLQLAVDGKPGDVSATLTYPTSGLGWRAAYAVTLLDNTGCHMRLDALASIANRSGRNYSAAMLKLVAGNAEHLARRSAPGDVQSDGGRGTRTRRNARTIDARRLSKLLDRRRARSPRCQRHAGSSLRTGRAYVRAALDRRERQRVVPVEAASCRERDVLRRRTCHERNPIHADRESSGRTSARAHARSRRADRIPRRRAHRGHAERQARCRSRSATRSICRSRASARRSASTRPRMK